MHNSVGAETYSIQVVQPSFVQPLPRRGNGCLSRVEYDVSGHSEARMVDDIPKWQRKPSRCRRYKDNDDAKNQAATEGKEKRRGMTMIQPCEQNG